MNKFVTVLALLLCTSAIHAEEVLSFGIVPQQSASKLARLWGPIFTHISKQTGLKIQFATAHNIPTFEKRLAKGEYDIAYMNPYHYTVFSKKTGYKALVKARDKKIKGIIVVRKDSGIDSLKMLNNSTLAFPAPAAFAATILTQSVLRQNNIKFTPKYVSSHDSVYRAVAKGIYPAGGGVLRTFKNVSPDIRNLLSILLTTDGYTPHAIAVHTKVKQSTATKIQQALVNMEQHPEAQILLNNIKLKGFQNALDSDWNDVRKLNIDSIKDN